LNLLFIFVPLIFKQKVCQILNKKADSDQESAFLFAVGRIAQKNFVKIFYELTQRKNGESILRFNTFQHISIVVIAEINCNGS
jgi:hypothetical protein